MKMRVYTIIVLFEYQYLQYVKATEAIFGRWRGFGGEVFRSALVANGTPHSYGQEAASFSIMSSRSAGLLPNVDPR